MKKKLDDDYDISVDDILNMTKDQEIGGFELVESDFYGKKGREKRNNLARKNEQIFSMKDGIFILEVEEDGDFCVCKCPLGMVEYFYSTNINDLI